MSPCSCVKLASQSRVMIGAFFLSVALAVCASARAAEALPLAARGAPRDTLCYTTIDTGEMLAMAGGLEGGRFMWRDTLLEQAGQRAESLAPILDYVTALLDGSSRMDIAVIDVAKNAAPKFYVDLTLRDGAEPELTPDWLEELVAVERREIAGQEIVSCAVGDEGGEMDIHAFIRGGHLYVCVYESVLRRLLEGLTLNAPETAGDGESLADNVRFASWYTTREQVTMETWLNTVALRRLVEQGLSGKARKDYETADRYLEFRKWQQITAVIDYDSSGEALTARLTVDSSGDIPLLHKLGLPAAPFPLVRYLPPDALGAAGVHLGKLDDLFERTRAALNDLLGGIRFDSDEEPEPDFADKREAELNAKLKDMGVDMNLKSLLGLFDGSMVLGAARAPEGEPFKLLENAPMFLIAGLTDAAKAREAAVAMAAAANEEKGEDTAVPFDLDGSRCYLIEGKAYLCLTEDAAVFSFGGDKLRARAQLRAMIAAARSEERVGGPLLAALSEKATLAMGLNVGALLTGDYESKLAKSLRFDRGAEPFFGSDPREIVDENFSVALAVTLTARRMGLSLSARGVNPTRVIQALMAAKTSGNRRAFDYARDQLRGLRDRVEDFTYQQGRPPESFEELIEAGVIRYHNVQSPNDKRFEGGESIGWFPTHDIGEGDEWEDEWTKILRLNEAKRFISYTLVEGADWNARDGRIIVHETAPNTAGGRMLLYANGQVGWLHESLWEQALRGIELDLPVPSEWEGQWEEKREERPGDDGKDDDMKGEHPDDERAPWEDSDDMPDRDNDSSDPDDDDGMGER